MQKTILFCAVTFIMSAVNSFGQCTSCTTTISGTGTSALLVNSGDTICITASGNQIGDIVINGGKVCNEGTISSFMIFVNGGELVNNEIIDCEDLAIGVGTFINNDQCSATDFGITGNNNIITNNGNMDCASLAVGKTGSGADPIFNNLGTITTVDYANSFSGEFNNYNQLDVTNDFAVGNQSTFNNYGILNISNDFANFGDFYTNCMVSVGNDWYSDGPVTGPGIAGNCGGFEVVASAVNDNDFGADDSYLDMCVGGTGGFTVNIGTLGSNVTNCSCTNTCVSVASVETESRDYFKLYPNPMRDQAILEFSNEDGSRCDFTLFNSLGQTALYIGNITNDNLIIEKADLPEGLYFFQLSNSKSTVISGKLVIE